MLRRIILVFLCFLFLIPQASSWSIDPAKWTVYMYEDEKITPQNITIKIHNNHETTLIIRLRAYNNKDLIYEEYEPLPNLTWVKLEKQIEIPPKTNYESPVTIDVENTTENYDKKWQFFISADQVAGGDTVDGTTFQYDYNLRWSIITPPVKTIEERQESVFPWIFILGVIVIVISLLVVALHVKKTREESLVDEIFSKK